MENLGRTAKVIEQGIERGDHFGAQLYVSLGGIRFFDAAIGESEPGQPLSRDSLLLWLSAGKPLVAVAIAQLWEKGQLELDDPVYRFIPGFEQKGKSGIQIRHLLTHTAGLRKLHSGWPDVGWEETLEQICQLPNEPGWEPGKKAGYHRWTSWFVLAEIIQTVSGVAIDQYLRERVTGPAGMTHTWLGMCPEDFRHYESQISPMFDTSRKPPARLPWTDQKFVTTPEPGRNVIGRIRDLGMFYETFLLGRRGERCSILEPATVSHMVARQRQGMYDQTIRQVVDFGLGFALDSKKYAYGKAMHGYGSHSSEATYGHGGFQSSVGFADPKYGLVVAMVFNGMPGIARHQHRVRSVTEAIYRDLELVSES
jgi:CubicO group peptidase (beta-lactamase class C family)